MEKIAKFEIQSIEHQDIPQNTFLEVQTESQSLIRNITQCLIEIQEGNISEGVRKLQLNTSLFVEHPNLLSIITEDFPFQQIFELYSSSFTENKEICISSLVVISHLVLADTFPLDQFCTSDILSSIFILLSQISESNNKQFLSLTKLLLPLFLKASQNSGISFFMLENGLLNILIKLPPSTKIHSVLLFLYDSFSETGFPPQYYELFTENVFRFSRVSVLTKIKIDGINLIRTLIKKGYQVDPSKIEYIFQKYEKDGLIPKIEKDGPALQKSLIRLAKTIKLDPFHIFSMISTLLNCYLPSFISFLNESPTENLNTTQHSIFEEKQNQSDYSIQYTFILYLFHLLLKYSEQWKNIPSSLPRFLLLLTELENLPYQIEKCIVKISFCYYDFIQSFIKKFQPNLFELICKYLQDQELVIHCLKLIQLCFDSLPEDSINNMMSILTEHISDLELLTLDDDPSVSNEASLLLNLISLKGSI